ncbi:LPXTG cell wall anchor domain-containing protein [Streptomyces sp. NPDC014894]|uniref:LPXTG cell wall anchor domain-containing protein n=1 Tax=Streptomyces sp. NPDC014894 TaxID=3364931 RepID=UPI0036FFA476
MKLRRALAVAAATAVLAPATFLAAPFAHAVEGETADGKSAAVSSSPAPDTSESESTSESPDPGRSTSADPSGGASTPAGTPSGGASSPAVNESRTPGGSTSSGPAPSSPAPGKSGDSGPTTSSPAPTRSDDPDEDDGFHEECAEVEVDMSINGLPGEIAAGSGWRSFTLDVRNTSSQTLLTAAYYAGASADRMGDELFTSGQVRLQAFDEESGGWQDLRGPDGEAVGFAGWSDELKPGHEVSLPLRIDVRAGAPAGAGFALGAGVYRYGEDDCMGDGEVAYRFRIAEAGADTDGTEPQEGGKVPVPTQKPVVGSGTGSKVTGSLAATGSDSALPAIGVAGGVAVLTGAGVVFALRRRRGDAAA